jgi:hypothetical protein
MARIMDQAADNFRANNYRNKGRMIPGKIDRLWYFDVVKGSKVTVSIVDQQF